MAILKYKDKDGNFIVLPTGGGSSVPPTAENVSYDNSVSGLEAENTQAAIDELSENVIDYSLDGTGTGLTIEGGLSVPRNQIIHCEVYKSGGNDYNYTGTALLFDTIITNEGECYNPETGLFTCPQDGMYLVNFTFFSNTTASTNHRPAIFLNNTPYVMSDGQYGKALTATISCKKNDTISIGSYSSSYNINFFTAKAHNLLTITLVNTLSLPNKKQQHQYSTDEQIIGTWVDGKPIYEKTFTGISNELNAYNSVRYTHIALNNNCDSIISYKGFIILNNSKKGLPLSEGNWNCVPSILAGYVQITEDNTLDLYIAINHDNYLETTIPYQVVVQYTKTTD